MEKVAGLDCSIALRTNLPDGRPGLTILSALQFETVLLDSEEVAHSRYSFPSRSDVSQLLSSKKSH